MKVKIIWPDLQDVPCLYRIAKEKRYSVVVDAEAEIYSVSDPELRFELYPIQKETPCGAWINFEDRDFVLRKRFVNLTGKGNIFAYRTPDAALEGFYRRKKTQARILRAQAAYVSDLVDVLHSMRKAGSWKTKTS